MTNDADIKHPDVQQLSLFLNGKLSEQASVLIEIHLESCECCLAKLDKIAQSEREIIAKINSRHGQKLK